VPVRAAAPRSGDVADPTLLREPAASRAQPSSSESVAAGDAEVRDVLASTAEQSTKVAALRRAASAPGWQPLFGHAVAEPRCSAPVRTGETAAEFALQRLLRCASRDPAARAALDGVAFGPRSVPDTLRERAARAFAATATVREAALLAARAETVPEPWLRDALLEGLQAAERDRDDRP
jgi:hypothetical protein